MDGEHFGTTADGEAVQRFTIAGGGLSAKIMNWGAVVQDLRLAGHDAPLVLGFEHFDDYPAHSPYIGRDRRPLCQPHRRRPLHHRRPTLPERHRISSASTRCMAASKGFGKRVWDVALHGDDFVTLTLHSPDGDMGFPGALDVTCTYRLKIPGTLSVELTATTDEPTLCNLAHHSYFNLDDGGSGDVLDHRLMLAAAAYLPVDDELIPTGVVQPVDGTPSTSGRRGRSATRRTASRPSTTTISASRRIAAG